MFLFLIVFMVFQYDAVFCDVERKGRFVMCFAGADILLCVIFAVFVCIAQSREVSQW